MKPTGPVLTLVVLTLVVLAISESASALAGQRPLALESGGLAPPDPIQRDPYVFNQTSTEQKLAEADREDSGRGLELIWLNAEVGYEYVGLQTFQAKDLVDAGITETSQGGLVVGGGLGVRFFVLTVGGRFRLGTFSAWDLWTANLEAGLHLPIGRVEPHFTFGGGYAAMGSFDSGDVSQGLKADALDISGWNVRGGFGLDVYITPVLSVGANISGEILFLTRSQFGEIPTATPDSTAKIYASDGKSIGGAGAATAVVGLHF